MANWNKANQSPVTPLEKRRFYAQFEGDKSAPNDITQARYLGVLATNARMYERQMERWGSKRRAIGFLDPGDNLHIREMNPEEFGEVAAAEHAERKITAAMRIGKEMLTAAIGFIEPTEEAFVPVITEPLTRVPIS